MTTREGAWSESVGVARWELEWAEVANARADRRVQETIDQMKFRHLRAVFDVKSRGSSLEIGCGTAVLSARLQALGNRTTCLDFSPTALRLAQARYRRAGVMGSFVRADAFHLPFRSDAFDVVLSVALLQHLPDPQAVVGEMVRVLRPGGVFYSDVAPARFSLYRAFDRLKQLKHRVQRRSRILEQPLGEAAIRGMLLASDLRHVRVFAAGIFPPIIPVLFRMRNARIAYACLLGGLERFWAALDDTTTASRLGSYLVATGLKPWRSG